MKTENFGSKWGAILAAAGSAIGLGNIWRFPYLVGEYGGFGFIFLYTLILIFICNPIMITELTLGRTARSSIVDTFSVIGEKAGMKHLGLWKFFGGWMGIIGLFLIISFYFLVAGWVIYYLFEAINGNLLLLSDAQKLNDSFTALSQNFSLQYACALVFLLLTALIIACGVKAGIERVSFYLMPVLFVIFVALAVQSIFIDGSKEGFAYLLKPDWKSLGFTADGFDAFRFGKVFSAALGQAFISLSLGYGMLLVYGSYVANKENIFSMVKSIEIFDTLAAYLSAIIIIPAIFAVGIAPTSGPGLTFISLPMVFQKVAGGGFWSIMFYLLLLLATLTSVISVYEGVTNLFIQKYKMKRTSAVVVVLEISVIGLTAVALSFSGTWNIKVFGRDLFDLFDHLSTAYTSSIMANVMSLFAGYGAHKVLFRNIGISSKVNSRFAKYYLFSLRYFVPVFISILLLLSLYEDFIK
ncbi:MAG: sodium-dependent transporter [Alphaproteobacteria bacterium]